MKPLIYLLDLTLIQIHGQVTVRKLISTHALNSKGQWVIKDPRFGLGFHNATMRTSLQPFQLIDVRERALSYIYNGIE